MAAMFEAARSSRICDAVSLNAKWVAMQYRDRLPTHQWDALRKDSIRQTLSCSILWSIAPDDMKTGLATLRRGLDGPNTPAFART